MSYTYGSYSDRSSCFLSFSTAPIEKYDLIAVSLIIGPCLRIAVYLLEFMVRMSLEAAPGTFEAKVKIFTVLAAPQGPIDWLESDVRLGKRLASYQCLKA